MAETFKEPKTARKEVSKNAFNVAHPFNGMAAWVKRKNPEVGQAND